jgi:hypothetical protein
MHPCIHRKEKPVAAVALVCVCMGTCLSVVSSNGNMSVTFMGLMMSFAGSVSEAVSMCMYMHVLCVCECTHTYIYGVNDVIRGKRERGCEYVYACICICMYVCECIHTYMGLMMSFAGSVSEAVSMSIYMHVCVYMCVCVHSYMNECASINIHTCIHIWG